LYAKALVPQIAQCRPSTFNRLREELLGGDINFQKTESIIRDLQDTIACFGLSCNDIGWVAKEYDGVNIPTCLVYQDRAPMALYQPTSDVNPVRVLQFQFLLAFDFLDTVSSRCPSCPTDCQDRSGCFATSNLDISGVI
jgi:hypothetical protein